MGLQDWTTDNDKFDPEDGGLTRLSFPCCACKHQSKTDADEPCRSCGHNVNAIIDAERRFARREREGWTVWGNEVEANARREARQTRGESHE